MKIKYTDIQFSPIFFFNKKDNIILRPMFDGCPTAMLRKK